MGGALAAGRSPMAIESINPATEEVLARFEEHAPARVEAAGRAFGAWSRAGVAERGQFLRRAAERLRAGKERYAGLITAEMGKPIAEAEAEIEKCAWNCEYYAEDGARFLA